MDITPLAANPATAALHQNDTTPLGANAPPTNPAAAANDVTPATADAGQRPTRLEAHLPPNPPSATSTTSTTSAASAATSYSKSGFSLVGTPTFVSAITTKNGMFLPSPPEDEDDKENVSAIGEGGHGGGHATHTPQGYDDDDEEEISVTVKRPSVHWGPPTTLQVRV